MTRLWLTGIATTLAACGGGPSTPSELSAEATRKPERIEVARVGEQRFTLADILASLARRGSFAQERFHAASAKLSYLQSFVDFHVLVREGISRGLHRAPAVARALKAALAEALWQKGKLPGLARARALTEPRLRAYHRAHRHAFMEPERARVSQILIKLPPGPPLRARQQARKAAGKVLEALGSQPDRARFAAVARRRSEDEATKAKGGELGWLARGVAQQGVPREVGEAAFRLSVGQTSGLVESAQGVHILRVDARRAGKPARFEAVRKQVEARLWRELRRAAFRRLERRLRREARVQVDAAQASALGETSRWLK